MMVTTTEWLKRDQSGELARVLAFIGLCAHEFGKVAPENVTPMFVPKDKAIDAGHWESLRAFYRPLNVKLEGLLGRRLGWEAGTSFGGLIGQFEDKFKSPAP